MQKDLLFYTWMHERYGCDGKMQVIITLTFTARGLHAVSQHN